MTQRINLQSTLSKALCVFVVACLVVSLSPVVAQADTTVGVRIEAPAQINETVAIGSAGAEDGEAGAGAGGEANKVAGGEAADAPGVSGDEASAEVKHINNEVALDPPTSAKPSHIAADVPLGTPGATSETLLVDNLTYTLDHKSASAALVGFSGNLTTKDVVVPAQVSDGTTTYTVTSIGQVIGQAPQNSFNPGFAGGGRF